MCNFLEPCFWSRPSHVCHVSCYISFGTLNSHFCLEGMVEIDNQMLSEDEAALYDRQIRLWGLDAQKRLRAARILIAGACGLGAEVIKNLILAGVRSIKILDHRDVNNYDIYSNFLTSHDSIGSNIAESSLGRAQVLNPMVEVSSDTRNLQDVNSDYFTHFDVVCLCRASREEIIRVNNICRQLQILLFVGDVYGTYGFMFADLINHNYIEEVKEKSGKGSGDLKQGSEETRMVKKMEFFVPFSTALDIDWTTPINSKRLKRITPSLFLMQVLQEFEFLHKRRPDPTSRPDDENELLTIKHTLFDKAGIPQEKLNNDFVLNIFGQVSPVCAIVGGVLAQEIIKAVSQKDQPLNNFFFFDPQDGAGVVECLCN